jgi:hypothetical protein
MSPTIWQLVITAARSAMLRILIFFMSFTVAPHEVKVRAMVFDIYPANYPAEGANQQSGTKKMRFLRFEEQSLICAA